MSEIGNGVCERERKHCSWYSGHCPLPHPHRRLVCCCVLAFLHDRLLDSASRLYWGTFEGLNCVGLVLRLALRLWPS